MWVWQSRLRTGWWLAETRPDWNPEMDGSVPNRRVMAKRFSTSHHPLATEPGFTHHSEVTLASAETVETIHVAENWSNHFLVHLSDIFWIYNLKSRFGWCPISIFFNKNLRSQELKKEAKESLNIKDGRMAKIIDGHRMSSQKIPTARVATGFGM